MCDTDVYMRTLYSMILDWHCTKYVPAQGKYVSFKFVELKPATHDIKIRQFFEKHIVDTSSLDLGVMWSCLDSLFSIKGCICSSRGLCILILTRGVAVITLFYYLCTLFLCQTAAAASDSALFCKIRPKAMYVCFCQHTLTGMKTKYDGNNLACLVQV